MEGEKSFFFVYCNALSNKKRKTVRQGGVAVELYVNKDGSLGRHRYPASLVHTADANTKCVPPSRSKHRIIHQQGVESSELHYY